jgi:hypothetical protein
VSVSPETVLASPIALHLARELAEQPVRAVLEAYRAAVAIALSFSTGSVWEDEDASDPAADYAAATALADLLNRDTTFSTHRALRFPQAVVSPTGTDTPAGLRAPQVLSPEEATTPGKPSRALWTSSFLAPDYPAWAAMAETGYVPVRRPLSCVEFLADPDDAEVFTIDSVADFLSLCDAFAVASREGQVSVDWRRVAESYHAVHLTFHGLILVQDLPVHCRLGPVMLRGWDSESTAWLRLPKSAELGERRLIGG